jgi:hypothetical protein
MCRQVDRVHRPGNPPFHRPHAPANGLKLRIPARPFRLILQASSISFTQISA